MALVLLAVGSAAGGTVTFTGSITQATSDGTGPAGNNTSLNSIQDNDFYSVTLVFPGSITSSGTFDLTGSSFVFSVPNRSVTESAFDSISLTVISNGAFDDLSILACLTTGSGCSFGNQLTANFEILAASLNGTGVAATGLDQPHPLDLLEDDGLTDIHGTIENYSYTGAASVPEPSTAALAALALVALAAYPALRRRPVRFAILGPTDCAGRFGRSDRRESQAMKKEKNV